jgi:hypothetical protein
MTIRTAAEIMAWVAKAYGKNGRFVTATSQVANYLLQPMMVEADQMDPERLTRLLAITNWTLNKLTWILSRFILAIQIEPASRNTEAEIINALINELKEGWPSLWTRPPPLTGRCWSREVEMAKTECLVIGQTGPRLR